MIIHPFEPVYDERSRVLVLGTFPSVASRETGFYYGHPRNRFWRVLAAVFGEPVPESIEEKRGLLLRRQIALWDVLQSCDITGSADSDIRNAVPNDIAALLGESRIERVLLNGAKAHLLCKRFHKPGIPALCLPSTSPANAAWSFERLCEAWSRALTGAE